MTRTSHDENIACTTIAGVTLVIGF